MREFFLAGAIAASALALVAIPTTASAASVGDDVALCAAALDAKGVATASDFRAKFLKSRGAAVRRVSVLMIPTASDKQSIEAECQIKKGEVIDIAVKA